MQKYSGDIKRLCSWFLYASQAPLSFFKYVWKCTTNIGCPTKRLLFSQATYTLEGDSNRRETAVSLFKIYQLVLWTHNNEQLLSNEYNHLYLVVEFPVFRVLDMSGILIQK